MMDASYRYTPRPDLMTCPIPGSEAKPAPPSRAPYKPAPKRTLQRAVEPPLELPVALFDDIRDPKEIRLLVRGVVAIIAAVALVVALGWLDVLGRLA